MFFSLYTSWMLKKSYHILFHIYKIGYFKNCIRIINTKNHKYWATFISKTKLIGHTSRI